MSYFYWITRWFMPAKLTSSQRCILALLARRGACYGADLVEASHGAVSANEVYQDLRELREKGRVVHQDDPPLIPGTVLNRRRYWLTRKGQKANRNTQ